MDSNTMMFWESPVLSGGLRDININLYMCGTLETNKLGLFSLLRLVGRVWKASVKFRIRPRWRVATNNLDPYVTMCACWSKFGHQIFAGLVESMAPCILFMVPKTFHDVLFSKHLNPTSYTVRPQKSPVLRGNSLSGSLWVYVNWLEACSSPTFPAPSPTFRTSSWIHSWSGSRSMPWPAAPALAAASLHSTVTNHLSIGSRQFVPESYVIYIYIALIFYLYIYLLILAIIHILINCVFTFKDHIDLQDWVNFWGKSACTPSICGSGMIFWVASPERRSK